MPYLSDTETKNFCSGSDRFRQISGRVMIFALFLLRFTSGSIPYRFFRMTEVGHDIKIQFLGRMLSISELYIMKSCTSRLLQKVTLSTTSEDLKAYSQLVT